MNEITCLRCKQPIDPQLDVCPNCGERVTLFQRTYSSRLIDGKYQILDRLGIGGMGEIFKVRHIHLNELRVIKIMRPNVAADDQGLQRFLQEARTSTMIKHKNLAMLYDFSQLDDGSYYMVWEFIDGTNIQKWIAQNGPVPARLTVEIGIQALLGLDHLHSMDLIHRDISPENIMLSQDHHGKLLVKVIDFGIAKQLAEGDSGQGLTQTGMFLGKLKYASPEQAGFIKDGEHLDARSDLYSFGIVLYEMVAGRAPFQATNPHGYILKHVTEKPLPVSELNPDVKVPKPLEDIIFKSLEKLRDNRYATAAEFAQALESVRGQIVPDQKFGLGERMITLSGAQTLADLPKMTTGSAATMGSAQTQQTMQTAAAKLAAGGTRAGSDDATVMERNLSNATMPGAGGTLAPGTFAGGTLAGGTLAGRGAGSAAPTTLERAGTFSQNDQATVIERLGMPGSDAQPTMIERQMSPADVSAATAKKRGPGMMIALAAMIVLAIAAGIFFMMRKGATATVAPATAVAGSTAGAQIDTPATGSSSAVPSGQGSLLLSASPWGEVESIMDASTRKPIELTDEKRSTPTRIDLPPGSYTVTMNGPDGLKAFEVNIEQGKRTPQTYGGKVDFDALEKEMNQQ
jgi:serine/threonine-protein kinase